MGLDVDAGETPNPAEPPRAKGGSAARHGTPKRDRSRRQILEAAVDSLVQNGYHRTSLSEVGRLAGVTRSGLQYHFPSLDDLLAALADHVLQWEWHVYEELTREPPPGRDPLDYAIDFVANPEEERYLIARLELVTAARTTPWLQARLETAAAEVDALGRRFVDKLFDRPGISDTERFTAARDLSSLLNGWLFAHIFPPGQRQARARGVLQALRVSLYTLWGLPLPDYVKADFLDEGPAPPAAKPRIRVAARRIAE